MNFNFALIGGDLRNIRLAEMLAKEKNQIYLYGIEKQKQLEENPYIKYCDTLKEAIDFCKIIIGPIPFSRDGMFLNTNQNVKKISIKEILNTMEKQILIAGNFSEEFEKLAKENKFQIIDLMKKEELAILNAIATAEGTIPIMIEETENNLQDCNILILGFGRIGKVLASKLKGLANKIVCTARKQEDLAWIEAYGYEAIKTEEFYLNLNQYDIIINTIPKMILTKEKLKMVSPKSLLIDLASKPGGIDFEAAKEKKIKTIWALGLPGKVAPESSAKYIKKIIDEEIKKERKILT